MKIKIIILTGILFCSPTIFCMEKKLPEFKRYIPESMYYIPEEQLEEELTRSELPSEVEQILYGIENISLLEGPEKRTLSPEEEFLEKEKIESPFGTLESLKITTHKKQENPTRIMTSKRQKPSEAHPGFPELWYEDSNLKNVEEAIKKGAPLNQPIPIHPLRYAVLYENLPLAELLLKYGSRPDISDMSGFTAKSAAEMKLRETRNPIYKEFLNLFEQPLKRKAGL